MRSSAAVRAAILQKLPVLRQHSSIAPSNSFLLSTLLGSRHASNFRHAAALELTNAIAAAGLGALPSHGTTGRTGPQLREALEKIVLNEAAASGRIAVNEASTEVPVQRLAKDFDVAVSTITDLENLRHERTQLRQARADNLAVGYQGMSGENQEFGALIVCATAGIFGVSIHYSFFAIFFASYYIYRRATAATREQRAAGDELTAIMARLRELEALDEERVKVLQSIVEAWREDRAE